MDTGDAAPGTGTGQKSLIAPVVMSVIVAIPVLFFNWMNPLFMEACW